MDKNRNKTRIFIVDDHDLYREGLKQLLSTHGDLEVVGEAPGAELALAQMTELQPDLALIDVLMPGVDGLHLVRRLLLNPNPPKFLLISQSDSDSLIDDLLKTPVQGYILKSEPSVEVIRGISAVMRGETYFSPKVSHRFYERLKSSPSTRPVLANGEIYLSPRELEVASFLAQGKTNREIGQMLGCSEHTIKAHKANLMRKIGAKNSAEVVAWSAEFQSSHRYQP